MISKTLAESMTINELSKYILTSAHKEDYKMLSEVLATKADKLTKDVHNHLKLSATYLERALLVIE